MTEATLIVKTDDTYCRRSRGYVTEWLIEKFSSDGSDPWHVAPDNWDTVTISSTLTVS